MKTEPITAAHGELTTRADDGRSGREITREPITAEQEGSVVHLRVQVQRVWVHRSPFGANAAASPSSAKNVP